MNLLSKTAMALLIAALPGLALAADKANDPLRIADQALNATYRDVMSRLGGEQRKSLLTAQRNWLGYRDTVCAKESTLPDAGAADGTSPMTRCLARLTVARTTELQEYGRTLVATAPTPVPAQHPTPERAPGSGPLIENCSLGELPAGFTVQAVGIYEGDLDTDVRLEASGHETRGAEVVVNHPGEDVVLVLMAYDPVLWTVRRTADTRLAAVIVGGYHAQAVLGVERTIPLLITTHNGPRKDCGRYFYAYKASRELLAADERIKELTGRGIDRLWSNYSGGRIHVGPAQGGVRLVSSDDYSPEDYTDIAPFPSGQKGIDRLVEMGRLRLATQRDIDAWVEAASAPYRRFDPSMKVEAPFSGRGAYVVLGPMEVPGGLYGAHSVVFLVPDGVPMPSGNAGHSTIYMIKDGGCRGPSCPQHR